MSGDNKTGKSGIREQAQGYIGPWIKVDHTQDHKMRVRFDIGCGKPDEKRGKLVTWRHCICYGKIAEQLQDIKQGDLVKVSGWVTTERISHPDEPLARKEYLILFTGEIVNKDSLDVKQLELSPTAG